MSVNQMKVIKLHHSFRGASTVPVIARIFIKSNLLLVAVVCRLPSPAEPCGFSTKT